MLVWAVDVVISTPSVFLTELSSRLHPASMNYSMQAKLSTVNSETHEETGLRRRVP